MKGRCRCWDGNFSCVDTCEPLGGKLETSILDGRLSNCDIQVEEAVELSACTVVMLKVDAPFT